MRSFSRGLNCNQHWGYPYLLSMIRSVNPGGLAPSLCTPCAVSFQLLERRDHVEGGNFKSNTRLSFVDLDKHLSNFHRCGKSSPFAVGLCRCSPVFMKSGAAFPISKAWQPHSVPAEHASRQSTHSRWLPNFEKSEAF
ncbi:hypothetical protein M413DRAFT_343802 [Hebeloma cylindrosporum]|uniref:Uncharacterized protein n=1 Tax=Hebeloma cylindrosporum TaxID=76867 RepID=A0A0C3CN59_HEBCY|nr:hypothetical protein M413DRAFT_343802 [Hebeloma cylindrosporum h7]